MAVDKKQHLESVLETHKMSHIGNLLTKHKDKRDEIKKVLEEKYTSNIYNIVNSGSYAKHTAINIKFDLDIVVPFKRDAFDSIEKMFDDVFDFLSKEFKDSAIIKKQKVSIGIIFNADEEGDVVDVDVVPGREISNDSYADDKSLHIYFNDDNWGFKKGTYTKTNIQAQINHIKDTGDEKSDIRKIIRLLKIWKTSNNESYKSFFLELITIKAFNKQDVTGDIWDKLKSVMEYIRDNVTKDGFTLKDPGNNNNNVADSLDIIGKSNLSSRMSTIINNIENNSENIKTYFPINEEFKEEEDSEDKYGIKDSAIIAPSIPRSSEQFG